MAATLDRYLYDGGKKKKPPLENYSQPTPQSNGYYSNQMTSLEQLYGKQKQDLTAQYQNQLQQAAIAQRMREKYLGNQLSAYGVKDTGLAQSSLVNLQNAYGTQRGIIGQGYQAASSGLESNYLTNRSNLEQSQYEMNLGQQQNLYNDLAGYLSQTETKEQAESLLDRYKGNIDDTQYKLLQDQIGLQGYGEVKQTEQPVTITNPKNTEQTKTSSLNDVMTSIKNSTWNKSGWDKWWSDNPEFTYNGTKYRVDTTTNYAGKNSTAIREIKAMTTNGVTKIVTYKGKDYLTDGETIYQVKIK